MTAVAAITGAGGFVGGFLRTYLEELGYSVVAMDADVREPVAVANAITAIQPTELYHLAGITRPASGDVDAFYRVNVDGARAVLDAVEQHAPQCRVLLVGSGYAYGRYDRAISEADRLEPLNHYGVSKAAADMLGAVYAGRGVHVVRARPFNHSGPGQHPDFVLPTLVSQVRDMHAVPAASQRLEIGNLQASRDFCDVRDVVRGYHTALTVADPGDVFNFGSGVATRIGDLLEMVTTLGGVTPEVEVLPDRLRADDIPILLADTAHADKVLGWQAAIPLEQTIRDMLSAS
jgi:GDP-4-dehydro-6-deoxy-D-mannose reductase